MYTDSSWVPIFFFIFSVGTAGERGLATISSPKKRLSEPEYPGPVALGLASLLFSPCRAATLRAGPWPLHKRGGKRKRNRQRVAIREAADRSEFSGPASGSSKLDSALSDGSKKSSGRGREQGFSKDPDASSFWILVADVADSGGAAAGRVHAALSMGICGWTWWPEDVLFDDSLDSS